MSNLNIHSLLKLLLLFGLTRVQGCFHEIDENASATTRPPPPAISFHLIEADSTYKLAMNVPGVTSKDLDVAVDYDQRRIDVTGIRKDPDFEYHQSWLVDTTVNIYDLTMAYTNGVITVSVPKQAPPKRTKKMKPPQSRGARSAVVSTGPQVVSTGPPVATGPPRILHTEESIPEPPATVAIHAPRLADIHYNDEEFEFWNHLI
jgi:HSP20 family molecular chaperone IbpA